jgi:hypothetical protein
MSAQRQRTIDFATEGLLLAHGVERNWNPGSIQIDIFERLGDRLFLRLLE